MANPGKRLTRARIEAGFKSTGAFAEAAGVSQPTIWKIEAGKIKEPLKLIKFAHILNVNPFWLTGEIGLDEQIIFSESGLNVRAIDSTVGGVTVRGAVAAGMWKEACEWPEEDWYQMPKPILQRYSDKDCYALLVQGESMNREYKPGSWIYCIPLTAVGRELKTGDHVVVQREDAEGKYECTIKEIEFELSGRVLLWPRSTSPDHESPLIIKDPNIKNRTDNTIIRVTAFVIGSWYERL